MSLGDWVCVFEGASWCWITRKTHEGYYRLITGADVYGIKDEFRHDSPMDQLAIC